MVAEYIYKRVLAGRSPSDAKARRDIGRVVAGIGIPIHLVPAIFKIFIGFFVSSVAIIADGVNNLFDTVSSVSILVGFRMAEKPADKRHPYGHGRIEFIVALIIAVSIIPVGIEFLQSAIRRIITPKSIRFEVWTVILLTIFIVVKLAYARLCKVIGEHIDSPVMRATAVDSLIDALITAVTLIPILLAPVTDWALDGWVALPVAIVILFNGIKMLKETMSPLIGEGPEADFLHAVKEAVYEEGRIKNIHGVRYERYGPGETLMVMDVELPVQLSFSEVHAVIDRVERMVSERFSIHLILHPEPSGGLTNQEEEMLADITAALKTISYVRAVYDFRVELTSDGPIGFVEVVVNSEKELPAREEMYREIHERLRLETSMAWKIRVVIDL